MQNVCHSTRRAMPHYRQAQWSTIVLAEVSSVQTGADGAASLLPNAHESLS